MHSISLVTFTQNEVCGTHLVFSNEKISMFNIRNFEDGKSLGGKVRFFFQLPWDNENLNNFSIFLCMYIHSFMLSFLF